MNSGSPIIREGTAAILVGMDGRLLFQLRDNLPHVSDPGKIGLFGGRREHNESFLECVVREVHEEIGLYLSPERFESLGRYSGPDDAIPGGTRRGEIFLVRDVPLDRLRVTEGRLKIVAMEELEQIHSLLAPSTKYALEIFLKRQPAHPPKR